jgi:hypothetical protein
MKKIFFVLILLLQTNLTFANINGEWSGWGSWTYDNGSAPCDMKISFEVSENSFSRKSGYFDCTVVGLDLPPINLKKIGNNLYDGEELVGLLTENSLELKENYSDTVTINTLIKIDGRHFDYQEHWLDQNQNEIYKITGRMFLTDHTLPIYRHP